MAEQNYRDSSTVVDTVDMYSIIRDVIRNLWIIILGAAAVAMIVNLVSSASYESTYTTSTTFVVSSQNTDTSVYSNLSAAQTMAENFTNILNSDILKKKVCEDLGMSSFDATASAAAVENTNLLTLTVTADSPKKAYSIIRSIMNNYGTLTQYVSGNMVMQVLQEPEVPTGVDVAFSANQQTRRWFVYAFAALLLVFIFLSYQKNTIKGQKDMEEMLDARDLGMVYYERKKGGLFRKKAKEGLLVSNVSSSFEYVERYKKISTMIVNAAKKNSAKSIVVTSVQTKEGRTTAAANIALTLAKQGYKVALIDADLRNPGLAKTLGVKVGADESISELLAGKADAGHALQYDQKHQMWLLLGQKSVKNSGDLISSGTFRKILSVLENKMDYIVIDTPAMSGQADAETLASMTDMSVMIVGYDRVLSDELNDAIDALKDSSPNMAGCILNAVKTLPGARRATGGYGGYGRYGRYGRYGNYGRYGRYGNYGKYGAYGHYARAKQEGEDEKE